MPTVPMATGEERTNPRDPDDAGGAWHKQRGPVVGRARAGGLSGSATDTLPPAKTL